MAETNATHVFAVRGGEVVTSRVVACPAGITRATVLELCLDLGIPAVERDLAPAELYAADEAFCTGTMGELVPVVEVDGRTIGAGELGPTTRRLSDAYAELTASSGTPVV